MGNNPSIPTEHVFYGETPVQFSHNLVSTLESSPETDSTRKKVSDLHIAQLAHSELQRIQSREDEILDKLSKSEQLDLASQEPADSIALSRAALANKISEVKERLEQRIPDKTKEDDKVTKDIRGELVSCLRMNDRRPLDCWKEVERFRGAAKRMEGRFVLSTVGNK